MKNKFQINISGFTGKELLLTLVVITLLCVTAVPVFNALQDQRREHQVRNVIRFIQTTLDKKALATLNNSQQTQALHALDDQPSGQPCTTCFNAVLKRGISNPLWFKISDTEYAFSRNGNFGAPEKYTEKGDLRVLFDVTSGKLTVEKR